MAFSSVRLLFVRIQMRLDVCLLVAWALFGIATMTILLSVLIEGWKSRYSTAINASKSGITIADRMRKLQLRKKAAEQARPDGAAAAAATTEGSPAVPKALAEPEEDDRDLATKLMENAKGFSRHAQFWMNQKSGAPPEELQRLMDETDELDGQADMQELRAIAQSAPEGSRQDLLFVISYASQCRFCSWPAVEWTTDSNSNNRIV